MTGTELTQLPISAVGYTKQDIQGIADKIVNNMLESGNETDVAIGLSVLESLIKSVKERKEFVSAVRDAIARQGIKGKMTLPNGTIIENAEVGTKYDYSSDNTWQSLNAELDTVKAKVKEREDLLKKIPEGKMMVDEDTGETIYAPVKTSTSSYKISLAK